MEKTFWKRVGPFFVKHWKEKGGDLEEKIAEILSLSYRDNSYSLFPHDVENAAAALALASVVVGEIPPEKVHEALQTFVRPPHRLEWVANIGQIAYVNDSKATSVDAVIKAVDAVSPPILLIAGGVDKGGTYRDWLSHFKDKVLKVFALGEAAERIKSELEPVMDVEIVSSLAEGVDQATDWASRALLSPAHQT